MGSSTDQLDRAHDVAAAFDELGRSLERQWETVGWKRSRFAALATEQLLEHDIPGRFGAAEVSRWLLAAEHLPQQEDPDARFGQPPITVFRSQHFYVAVLYWGEIATAIHEHGFSGAFQILEGSSIHGVYDFTAGAELNELVQLGSLTRSSMEPLSVGYTHPIESGTAFIHALVRLDRPSATILVRTYRDPWAQPQFAYSPPGIRYDPTFRHPVVDRQLAMLQTLGFDSSHASGVVARMLASKDPQVILRMLFALSDRHIPRERFEPVMEPLRVRHPQVVAALLDAYEARRRIDRFLRLGDRLTDPDHKFLVALSALRPAGPELASMLRSRHPTSDPSRLHATWASEIARELLQAPSSDWAGPVVSSLQQGADLQDTMASVRREHPEIADRELRVVKELFCRLPEMPVLGDLIAQGRTLRCETAVGQAVSGRI